MKSWNFGEFLSYGHKSQSYLAPIRFSPCPLDLVLKHSPVEIFQKEFNIVAIVQIPAVDTSAQCKTPSCLLDSHMNISWQWMFLATCELEHYIPSAYLQLYVCKNSDELDRQCQQKIISIHHRSTEVQLISFLCDFFICTITNIH